MDWSLFPRGAVIGVSVALPVGPMAVLCIRRTIAHGRLAGFVSGGGIASGDAIYGAIAAFGLTSISSFLVDLQDVARFVGGLFLVYLGVRTLRSRAAESARAAGTERGGRLAAYISALGLTLTNPATILSFAAIFSGFGVASEGVGAASASALTLGVFAGSIAWWALLTVVTSFVRGALTPPRLTWLNRLSGTVILVFGLLALGTALR